MFPGENSAAYAAYDSTEIELPSGRVVRCPSLTVAEGVRYCRLFDRGAVDVAGHAKFFAEFPKRVGILDERLVDLGVQVEGLAFGEMLFCEAVALVQGVDRAARAPDVAVAARLLDKFRCAVGLPETEPEAVFAAAERFVVALYRCVYAIARDLLLPPALKPEESVGGGRGRRLTVGLDDMLSEYGACYGGFPAPDSSWRMFLAGVKLAARHEARTKLITLDAVSAAIAAAFGDKGVASGRDRLADEAYPFAGEDVQYHPNMFAPDYQVPADA
jgi:hypothetical protein